MVWVTGGIVESWGYGTTYQSAAPELNAVRQPDASYDAAYNIRAQADWDVGYAVHVVRLQCMHMYLYTRISRDAHVVSIQPALPDSDYL